MKSQFLRFVFLLALFSHASLLVAQQMNCGDLFTKVCQNLDSEYGGKINSTLHPEEMQSCKTELTNMCSCRIFSDPRLCDAWGSANFNATAFGMCSKQFANCWNNSGNNTQYYACIQNWYNTSTPSQGGIGCCNATTANLNHCAAPSTGAKIAAIKLQCPSGQVPQNSVNDKTSFMYCLCQYGSGTGASNLGCEKCLETLKDPPDETKSSGQYDPKLGSAYCAKYQADTGVTCCEIPPTPTPDPNAGSSYGGTQDICNSQSLTIEQCFTNRCQNNDPRVNCLSCCSRLTGNGSAACQESHHCASLP